MQAKDKENLDGEQVRMLDEMCLLVDREDRVLGTASKKECHLMENIRKGMLHRAFSVFLFSRDGKLLLQQRSGAKITFPLRWTNTCCSHPLDIDGEREEKGHLGVKRAAVRKLEHELGIKRGAVPVEALKFLTRIYYLAESDNETWGEHEIDHILFAQCDVACAVNENEVAGVMWVTKEELQRLFAERAQRNVVLTPWFEMIANQFLFKWWDQLDHIMKTPGDLADAEAHAIHHLRLN